MTLDQLAAKWELEADARNRLGYVTLACRIRDDARELREYLEASGWRAQLPTTEQVKAHEAHGGKWQRRIGASGWIEEVELRQRPGGPDILAALAGAAAVAIEIMRGRDDDFHDLGRWDLGREWRPCIEGMPIPWPEVGDEEEKKP